MGVSVTKKRACPHLPPRHQTETAVRPMARPAATRENTTVDPLCRLTDGARGPRADSLATGKQTRPLQNGLKRSPQTGVPPSRWEGCLRWASPRDCRREGIPPIHGWEEVKHKPYYSRRSEFPRIHARRRSERNDLIDAHVAKSRVEIGETSDSHSIDGLAGFVQCSSTLGFPNFFGEAALGCALVTEHQ